MNAIISCIESSTLVIKLKIPHDLLSYPFILICISFTWLISISWALMMGQMKSCHSLLCCIAFHVLLIFKPFCSTVEWCLNLWPSQLDEWYGINPWAGSYMWSQVCRCSLVHQSNLVCQIRPHVGPTPHTGSIHAPAWPHTAWACTPDLAMRWTKPVYWTQPHMLVRPHSPVLAVSWPIPTCWICSRTDLAHQTVIQPVGVPRPGKLEAGVWQLTWQPLPCCQISGPVGRPMAGWHGSLGWIWLSTTAL